MSKQTSVEWLVEQLPIRILNMYHKEIEQAKEMNKDHIMEAYMKAKLEHIDTLGLNAKKNEIINDTEKYYNETFNTTHDQPQKVLGKIEKSDCQEAAEKRQSEKKNENT
jgi:hypothetical protein